MLVDLDIEDLKSLVKGIEPSYSQFDNALVATAGYYIGGHVEKWVWNRLDSLTEHELYSLYFFCKNKTSHKTSHTT